jgi:predicted Zn-dependent peptidase
MPELRGACSGLRLFPPISRRWKDDSQAMEFLTHVLPNGLEIVAEVNPEAYSTALAFIVKTGSRDESDEIAGVSHFLEHMVFKGTPTRSADDVNRELDEIGSHANAGTSEETTVYYAPMLPEYQTRATDVLADILRPSLREAEFVTEKNVILEEIQMCEDQPPFGADDKCRAAFFGKHPLGRSVLGTMASIQALPLSAMRDYYHRRYAPGNIVLAAAGRVDFDRLVADCRRTCGSWAPAECPRVVEAARPKSGFSRLTKASATQQYILQMSLGPAAHDEDRYAAKVLTIVLGDDSGSRLYWEVVDPGLAESAELSHGEYQGSGVFFTQICCAPEDAGEVYERAMQVYETAHADGITAEELTQAKNKVRSQLVLSSERPSRRMFGVGGDWVYRREYRSLADDLDLVASIRLDDIDEVLKRYSLIEGTALSIGP